MKNEKLINNGGVCEEQIQAWKNRYRKIASIEVSDGDELHTGYFHRPDMDTMAAVNKLGKSDEVKAAEILFANCWLGGSVTLQQDAVVKMAAIGQLNELMSGCIGKLKNL